jgi:hypothetical protein
MAVTYVTSALLGRHSDYNAVLREVDRDLQNPDLEFPELSFLVRANVYLQLVQRSEINQHPLFIRQVREFVRNRPLPPATGPIPTRVEIDFELLALASVLQDLIEGLQTTGPFDETLATSLRITRSGVMERNELQLLLEAQTYMSLIRDMRLRSALTEEVGALVDDIVEYMGLLPLDRREELDRVVAEHPVGQRLLPYHV